MSHAKFAMTKRIFDLIGQFENAQEIGYHRAVFCDAFGNLFLFEAALIDEHAVCFSFFDRVEVLALDVLNDGELKNLAIGVDGKRIGWYVRKPCLPCSTYATFT